tara:strand:+ start:5409 stop:6383 length:975 start_codon:yes stop_codon:yes gene_type:complete
MNNISFFKKYKPKNLNDLNYKSQLVDFFLMLIELNNLNCLLVGNSGSGKTTLIRVFINEYYKNISNYNDNIMYINSLSECGVNFYRTEVKTFCQIPCSIHNKKKIIVIDDLDNINEQSQQIFRNFIDNYRHNVFFISSCSNLQKIIETLQSRLNIIKIPDLTVNSLTTILDNIINKENIIIENDAKEFTLTICNNSIRTLLAYLEKFYLLGQPMTLNIVQNICTNINYETLTEYTQYILEDKDILQAQSIILSIYNCGYSVVDILDSYFNYIKNSTIITESGKYKIIQTICKYISYFYTKHEDSIELCLFTHELFMANNKLITL